MALKSRPGYSPVSVHGAKAAPTRSLSANLHLSRRSSSKPAVWERWHLANGREAVTHRLLSLEKNRPWPEPTRTLGSHSAEGSRQRSRDPGCNWIRSSQI